MSEHDDDVLLRHAFGELAHLTAQTARPAGVRAARSRAAQRRNRAVVALACLVVLVIVLPVAIFASGVVRRAAPLIRPPVTQSSTPTAGPTTLPPPGETPPVVTPATDGAGVLANATVSMPLPKLTQDGGCGDGPITYRNGHAEGGEYPGVGGPTWVADIAATARVDVNHDGTDEIIAKVSCAVSDGRMYMVVAVQRQPNGRFTTLAVVVDPYVDTVLRNVRGVAVTSEGSVRVEVTNGKYEGPWDPPEIWQWREYEFSAGRFAQTGGPTSFVADSAVAGFDVTASYTVGASADGWTDLRVAIGLRAKGPQAVPVQLIIGPFGNEVRARPGADLGKCPLPENGQYVTCDLGNVAAGDAENLILPLQVIAQDVQDLRSNPPVLRIRTGGSAYPDVKLALTN